MGVSVSGCSTAVTSGCHIFGKKISTSKQDVLTRQTEDEIIGHNANVEKFCR